MSNIQYVKYFTRSKREALRLYKTLHKKFNLPTLIDDNGIIINRHTFNSIPVEKLPRWIARKHRFRINQYTFIRPASEEEINYLQVWERVF